MRLSLRTRLLVIFTAALLPLTANASGPGYIEALGGFGAVIKGSPFLTDAPSVSLGPGATLNLAWNPSHGRHGWIRWSLGISNQYSMLSTTPGMSILGVYPYVRMQLAGTYLSLGATPLVFRNTAAASWETPAGVVFFLVEAGYDWEITPEISILTGFSSQTGYDKLSGISPFSTAAVKVGFRFYLFPDRGFSDRHREYGDDQDPYRGWRYPYGQGR